MAQDMEALKLPPKNENNPVLILLQKMKLLLLNGGINPLERAIHAEQLLATLGGIFSSPSRGQVFVYLLEHGAATSWTLQVDLSMPEATVYRVLKYLRGQGYVLPAIRVPKQKASRGGPRPTVWMIAGGASEDVATAMHKHNRALSPNYRVAEEIKQLLLQDFKPEWPNDFNYRDVVEFARNRGWRGPLAVDVATMTCTLLKNDGYRVSY